MEKRYVRPLFLLTVYAIVSLDVLPVESEVSPSIQWTAQNQLFHLNRTILVKDKSKITIICPNIATVMKKIKDSPPRELLYNNLWIVNNASYWSCNASPPESRLLLKCNSPLNLKYYTIVFQRYSASTNLEFQQGKEYYFIATSDGTRGSINSRQGGFCKTHNMRIRFYVCKHGTDEICNPPPTTQATTVTTPRETTRVSETVTTKLTKTIKREKSTIFPTTRPTTIRQQTTSAEKDVMFLKNVEPDKPVMNYQTGDKGVITLNITIVIILVVIIALLAASNTYLYCRLKARDENRKSLDRKQSIFFKISICGKRKNRERPSSDIVVL